MIDFLTEEENITREEAIARFGDSLDEYGTPYKIIGKWQTEFIAIIEPK